MPRSAVVLIALVAGGAVHGAPHGTVVRSADEHAWHDVKLPDGSSPGLRTVDLWGVAARGAHGSLTRFPAGLKEPLHRHSHVLRVVVLAGTMGFSIEGAETEDLGPGSFVSIPAGVTHSAECRPAGPCEVLVEQDGAMDVQLVGRR